MVVDDQRINHWNIHPLPKSGAASKQKWPKTILIIEKKKQKKNALAPVATQAQIKMLKVPQKKTINYL